MPLFSTLVAGAVAAAVATGVVGARARERAWLESFREALSNDVDVTLELVGPRIALATKPPHQRASLVGTRRSWSAHSTCARLGARTTLDLRREGVRGSRHDVHIGNPGFDDAFHLGGTEPTIVRGVFTNLEMQRATGQLFTLRRVISVHVREDGGVKVLLDDDELSPAECRTIVVSLGFFVEILERFADAAPVAAPEETSDETLRGAGSSATGAPVGVPLGEGR